MTNLIIDPTKHVKEQQGLTISVTDENASGQTMVIVVDSDTLSAGNRNGTMMR